MKSIILVSQDRNDISESMRHEIVQTILEDGNYQISLMVVNATVNKEEYLCYKGIGQVMTSLELEYMESMKGLNYGVIAKSKHAQLDIENGLYRLYADYQLDKYYYYASFCFWNRFFEEHQVDMVVHTKDYHGFTYDVCDIVARNRGIECTHLVLLSHNDAWGIFSQDKLLPIFHGHCESVAYMLESSYDKSLLPPSVEKKSLPRRLLYNMGGNLLEDFMVRLSHWDWQPRSIIRKRRKIFWSDKFLGYMKLLSIRSYVQSISCYPDFSRKYICYFLHVEPEASISVKTILESQLVIIKMLSESIPEGWCLYVKEHPAQFDVNNDSGYYHMFDMPLFKTKAFYEKIISMPNVKIVPFTTKSADLVCYSQAVASILGTVLLESVLARKPMMAFSDLTPCAYMEEVFSIHSYDECENAIRKIAMGFVPEYKDADSVIGKYAFQGKYMAKNILSLLYSVCP